MANIKKKLSALLVGTIMAVSVGVVSASHAEAINRVTCGTRTDWLILYSEAPTCWANAGTVSNITLYRVKAGWGGNNAGSFKDSAGASFAFAKWELKGFSGKDDFPTIKSITIK